MYKKWLLLNIKNYKIYIKIYDLYIGEKLKRMSISLYNLHILINTSSLL